MRINFYIDGLQSKPNKVLSHHSPVSPPKAVLCKVCVCVCVRVRVRVCVRASGSSVCWNK